MTERQNQKRHHCHGDAGKSGTDDLLPPCQQAERNCIGEHAHADAMHPDPAVRWPTGWSAGPSPVSIKPQERSASMAASERCGWSIPRSGRRLSSRQSRHRGRRRPRSRPERRARPQSSERRSGCFCAVHQVTALRAWNSGCVPASRSPMIAAILSTACHTSAYSWCKAV